MGGKDRWSAKLTTHRHPVPRFNSAPAIFLHKVKQVRSTVHRHTTWQPCFPRIKSHQHINPPQYIGRTANPMQGHRSITRQTQSSSAAGWPPQRPIYFGRHRISSQHLGFRLQTFITRQRGPRVQGNWKHCRTRGSHGASRRLVHIAPHFTCKYSNRCC